MLLKNSIYKQTQQHVQNITFLQLEAAAVEIKNTGRCTDLAILDFERQMQVVAKTSSHSHSQCAEQATHIKALMINDGMPTLWITLNPSDLQSPLILLFAGVQLDPNFTDTITKHLRQSTAVMNPVAVV